MKGQVKLTSIMHFITFFVLIAFVVTCNFLLFLFIIVSYPLYTKSNLNSALKKGILQDSFLSSIYLNFTAVPYTITSAAPCIREDDP